MRTKLVFAATALLFTTAGFSQALPKTKDSYKRKEFNLPSMDQPIIINNDSAQKRIQQLKDAFIQRNRANLDGQYSHSTLNGKIVVLPPDNMPCLVPEMNQVVTMPNTNPQGVPPAPMPGAKNKTRPPLNR